jgi:peptidoglycan/LPS O-acetylase OafA/YrhL
MRTLLREVLVITAAAVCLAGPVAATVVPLSPEAWRRPPLVWGILLGTAALVACLRSRRWRRR